MRTRPSWRRWHQEGSTRRGAGRRCKRLIFQPHTFPLPLHPGAVENELRTPNHCANQLRPQKQKQKVATVSSVFKIYVKRKWAVSPVNLIKVMSFRSLTSEFTEKLPNHVTGVLLEVRVQPSVSTRQQLVELPTKQF